MSAFNMVPVSERLPEKHRQVLLIADRFWNTPDGVPAMRVTATGYLSDFGHPHWSIFGERALPLDAFCLWAYVNDPATGADHDEPPELFPGTNTALDRISIRKEQTP